MNLSSGTQSLIAGALFDFVGYLTTRPKTIKAGGSETVYDVHDAFLRWARERKLDVADAKVEDWEKTASVVTIQELAATPKDVGPRIAGALTDFVDFVKVAETEDYEQALVRWATKTGLEIHDPQERWSTVWWA